MQRFQAHEYLKIDIANNFGKSKIGRSLDKCNWDERIEWFNENEHQLESLLKQADEPALYFAGLQAWNAYKTNQPSGYPISLDGTSSGLQILSCLTGDRLAAQLCNVINTGNREDAYRLIYEYMCELIDDTSKISRDACKDAIMTAFYGSEAIPKEVFGEGDLLRAFFYVMEKAAPAVWNLNKMFLDMWDNTRIEYRWKLPDNFTVIIPVISQVKEVVHVFNEPFDTFRKVNAPIDKGRSLSANTTHSVDGFICRELNRRCNYDPAVVAHVKRLLYTVWHIPEPDEVLSDTPDNEMFITLWNLYIESGYLSARILPYINEENINFIDRKVILELVDSLPEKPFKMLQIHDCFRCLPKYGNDLRYQYNLQLALIAKSNLLSFMLSQILGRTIKVNKADENLWKDILDSNYSLS